MNDLLKNKIREALSQPFVGDFFFSPDDLEEIYLETSIKLDCVSKERGATLSALDYDMVFVALVNLIKEWLPDSDTFWEYIFKKLGIDSYQQKIYSQVTNVVDRLAIKNKIFILDSFKKKYYATICSHAFAPISSSYSFFDMCWEIYCCDLNESYEPNDPVCDVITKSLQQKLKINVDNDDDFQIGSKVYSFRAGIKGLAVDQPELLSKLLDKVMTNIHSLFNGQVINLHDSYLNSLMRDWWIKKEASFGILKPRKVSGEHVISDYSQIKTKYNYIDGIAYLTIPAIRLLENVDYEPYLEIYINNEQKICEPLELYGSGILMATKIKRMALNDLPFAENIRVVISHCGKTIYDSKDSMKRDYILFKNEKEVFSKECFPGNYTLYVKNFENLYKYPSDIGKITLNTYSLDANNGDILQSKDNIIFFVNEKQGRKLYFVANENNKLQYRMNDKEYKVIDGDVWVDVDNEVDMKDFGVKYENETFKLSDFSFELLGDKRRYLLSLLTDTGDVQEIKIFKYSDNSVVNAISFIKFNQLKIVFDKPLYYDQDDCGFVTITSDKFEEKKKFTISDNEISIKIGNGDLIINPPVFKWKIDDGEWHYHSIQNGLWYKDFTNTSQLYVSYPEDIICDVCINNEKFESSTNSYTYKLGEKVYAMTNKGSTELLLYININGSDYHNRYLLSQIYLKEKFAENPVFIFSQKHELIWIPRGFIGDKNSKFELEIYGQDNIMQTIQCDLKERKFSFDNFEDDFYQLKVSLIKPGFLKQKELLFEERIVLGNEKELIFKNKMLEINSVMLFDDTGLCNIKKAYIDCIKYRGTKDGFDYYYGKMFIMPANGHKTYLDFMKNDNGQMVKINPVRIEMRSQKSCYLGYGFYEFDEDFEYDDDFVLDSQRKINVMTRLNGIKSKNINYFVFEVKNV